MGTIDECLCGGLYILVWILGHIFPFIGQYNGYKIWSNRQNSIFSNNPSDIWSGWIGISLASYLLFPICYLIYIGLLCPYFNKISHCINNYNNISSKLWLCLLLPGIYWIVFLIEIWVNALNYGLDAQHRTIKHHLALLITTLGLFHLFYLIGKWWKLLTKHGIIALSDSSWKRRWYHGIITICLSCGVLLIFMLITEYCYAWKYCEYLYKENHHIKSHLLACLLLPGIYWIYLYVKCVSYLIKLHLIYRDYPNTTWWDNMNYYFTFKYQKKDIPIWKIIIVEFGVLILTFGSYLILSILWYIIRTYDYGVDYCLHLIYQSPPGTSSAYKYQKFWCVVGHIGMCFLTCGLWILVSLTNGYSYLFHLSIDLRCGYKDIHPKFLNKKYPLIHQLVGHVVGLVFPPFLIWGVGYLYVSNIEKLNKIIKGEEFKWKPISFLAITSVTGGLASIYYYYYYFQKSRKEAYYYADKTQMESGRLKLSILTLGLGYIYYYYYSRNNLKSLIARLWILNYSYVILGISYWHIDDFHFKYLLWGTPLMLLFLYEISDIIIYNNWIRITLFKTSCYLHYKFYLVWLFMVNTGRKIKVKMTNSIRNFKYKINNNMYNPMTPYLTLEDENYHPLELLKLELKDNTFGESKMVKSVVDSLADTLYIVMNQLKIDIRHHILDSKPTGYQRMLQDRHLKYRELSDPFIVIGYFTYSENRFQDVDTLLQLYNVSYDKTVSRNQNLLNYNENKLKIRKLIDYLPELERQEYTDLNDLQSKIKDRIFYLEVIANPQGPIIPPPDYDDNNNNNNNNVTEVILNVSPPGYGTINYENQSGS